VNHSKLFSKKGILGAKITGGGSGGTVCLLTNGDEGRNSAEEIHKHFCGKYGQRLVRF
jgi:mevalonate kinase